MIFIFLWSETACRGMAGGLIRLTGMILSQSNFSTNILISISPKSWIWGQMVLRSSQSGGIETAREWSRAVFVYDWFWYQREAERSTRLSIRSLIFFTKNVRAASRAYKYKQATWMFRWLVFLLQMSKLTYLPASTFPGQTATQSHQQERLPDRRIVTRQYPFRRWGRRY